MCVPQLKRKHPSLKVLKTYPPTGQKQVYLVSLEEYGKVVLKVVKKMDERIMREIAILNGYDIPHVPKILETSSIRVNGETKFYLLEEYIDGKTLTELLGEGRLPLKRCLDLLETLLVIVAKLESIRIVHRDIKPDNIIMDRDGVFHLIDFGIARMLGLPSLTVTDVSVGPHTPGYGAPELFQYNKAVISSKADLFSIGVVAYQAIFGKHPFLTGTEWDLPQVWYRTATRNPEVLTIPGDTDGQLFGFISTLMQKQASKRPPDAAKALEWFRLAVKTVSPPPRPPSDGR